MKKNNVNNTFYHRSYPHVSATNQQLVDGRAKYVINTHPLAQSGRGGHATTFALACKLARIKADHDWIMIWLTEYNDRLEEQWSVPELSHKAEDALKTAGTSQGMFARKKPAVLPYSLPQSKPILWSKLKPISMTQAVSGEAKPDTAIDMELVSIAVIEPPRLTTPLTYKLLN